MGGVSVGKRKFVQRPGEERERMVATAEKIAAHYGVPFAEVRHTRYLENTRGNWTMRENWERLLNGEWVQEPPFPGWCDKFHG